MLVGAQGEQRHAERRLHRQIESPAHGGEQRVREFGLPKVHVLQRRFGELEDALLASVSRGFDLAVEPP
ncbi:hypothetical protein, partial [Streptosporangium minutum]|uniref:hypothetical protein n=1 Tax=Streptosporangium minutum TaxID=569862 RepID=UPI001F6113C7